MNKLATYFFKGILLVAPIAITIYVLVGAFRFLDDLLSLKWPGVGILILLAGVTLIGAVSQTLLINPLLGQLEKLINKVPLAALIYASVKDLLSAFVGDKKKFDRPVTVELVPGSGVRRIGFVTQDDLKGVFSENDIAVYLPHSYNISGEVMIIPRERVLALHWSSTDAMKFVVSGGVAWHGRNKVTGI